MSASPDPALAIAQSHALLARVAARQVRPGIRVYRPEPTAAFGRLDLRAPGFGNAAGAATRHGLAPVLRLVGGRVAVYTRAAVVVEAFTQIAPDESANVEGRFAALTTMLVAALRSLGLDAQIGELPGEYCPGTHSVNLGHAVKVGGVGQRVIRRAAVTSAVLTVGDGPQIRDALTAIQRELGVDWEPRTAGSIDEHAPAITTAAVEQAIRAATVDCDAVTVDSETAVAAVGLRAGHDLARTSTGASPH